MAFHGRNLLRVTSFIFLATLVCGQLTVRLHNTWTFIGERTILKCCSHDENVAFIWRKYLETGRAQKICSKGDDCPYDANYIIENSTPGCSNLVIESTSGRDSTYFECAIDGTGDKSAAYVIPYNCHPDKNEQSDFVEGDVVTFRCEVLCQNKQFSSYWMNEHGKILKWNNFTGGSCVSTWIVSLQIPELKAYTWVLQFLMDPNIDEQFDKTNTNITWTSKKEKVGYPLTNIRESSHNLNPDYISPELSNILIYLQILLACVVFRAIADLPSCLSNMHSSIKKAKKLYDGLWKDSQPSASKEETEICLRSSSRMGEMVCDDDVPGEQRETRDDGLEEQRELNGNSVQKTGGARPDLADDEPSTVIDMRGNVVTEN